MQPRYDIAIIGAGIGGLSAALLLHRQGHHVQIYERFETPQPLGSGLVIQPVGQDVLLRLGVLERCIQHGASIFHMQGHEANSGMSVLDVRYGPDGGKVFGLGIHRGAIFSALYDAVITEGIPVTTGFDTVAAPLSERKRTITSTNGDKSGPFDLVIDASGARSTLSPIKVRPLPFGAIWGTVDWPNNTTLPRNKLTQCYARARHMTGVLPLGRPNGGVEKAAIFWSLTREDCTSWPDLPDWRDTAAQLWPEFRPFLDKLSGPQNMTLAQYSHGTLGAPYGRALAYIGDAAHQASPQLGQGANMALLDAAALADTIAEVGLPRALPDYAARRWAHMRLYQLFSAVFTPFYQSHSRALPVLRDHIFNPVSRVWPARGMLTKLVCGNLIRPD